MNITIKRASIRGSLFLNYEFEQSELGVKNNIKTNSDAPIHEDLRRAFRSLIPHYAFACEEVMDSEVVELAINNPEQYLLDEEVAVDKRFFKYRVYGFSIKERNGIESVEILGSKRLENFEEIPFSTYDIDLNDGKYIFVSELNDAIDHLRQEVMAYMQGKVAPKAQMEMFAEDDGEAFDDI